MDADVTQRNSARPFLKISETSSSAFRRTPQRLPYRGSGLRALSRPRDERTGHQRLTCQHQTFIQQLPEGASSPFASRAIRGRFRLITPSCYDHRGSARRFHFPTRRGSAAAHRGFKRTGDFHYLIVVQISGYMRLLAHSSASCLMS